VHNDRSLLSYQKYNRGTGNHYAHRVIWAITNVDSGNTRITITNTNRSASFPTNTLTGGDVSILTTVLSFTDCIGISVDQTNLGLIDKCALVGNGYSGSSGVFADNNGSIKCGSYFGVSNFYYGYHSKNNSTIVASNTAVCGNSYIGAGVAFGGNIIFDSGSSNGNGSYGIFVNTHGSASCGGGVFIGNAHSGVSSAFGGSINANSSFFWGNLNSGYTAQGGI